MVRNPSPGICWPIQFVSSGEKMPSTAFSRARKNQYVRPSGTMTATPLEIPWGVHGDALVFGNDRVKRAAVLEDPQLFQLFRHFQGCLSHCRKLQQKLPPENIQADMSVHRDRRDELLRRDPPAVRDGRA
jgi:hypothetical protein